MKMKKKSVSKLYLYGAIGCVAAIACIGYLYCFSAFSKSSETK
ncbi:MAG: aminodeoxychorismate lyase, partial [Prevotella sp.]|nr:aminodeoxychorismate lyase [Prevotella sp.]